MDKYSIDSHKLMYHVERVSRWLAGENIYPIYMEVSPTGACNHRCIYCALDFMEYQPRFLETDVLRKRLFEMGRLGVKSIMYAGEGEPLLHRDIADIVAHTKRAGIEAAITTNGVLLHKRLAEALLPCVSWIKVSINAATRQTYAFIHRTHASDLGKVYENLSWAAERRAKKKYSCALGMQIILLPENADEVVSLARRAKRIGMDYLVVKPYSQHPGSITRRYQNIKYAKYLTLAQKLQKFNDARFQVIFRIHTMQKWDQAQRSYQKCLALPFWAYIDSGGGVWACSIYLSRRRFLLGNINAKTFRQILESRRRRSLLRWAKTKLDIRSCRINCRMDEVNRYLWDVVYPPPHANFI